MEQRPKRNYICLGGWETVIPAHELIHTNFREIASTKTKIMKLFYQYQYFFYYIQIFFTRIELMCLCTLYRNTYQQYSTLEESSLFVEDDDTSEIGNITLGYVVATQVRTLRPRSSPGLDYTHKYEESKATEFLPQTQVF